MNDVILTLYDGFDYNELLRLAVAEIQEGRAKVARQINSSLTGVYWNLGKMLVER